MARLVALLLPLSLDTFAIAAALGIAGLPTSQRWRVSLLFAGFEAGMPLVGVAIGQAAGRVAGTAGDYLASGALLAIGGYLIVGAEDGEVDAASRLSSAQGLTLLALGVSISLDELAIGFSAGLLHLPLAWAIALIGSQALLAAQLGLRFGARLGERVRERAERAAGLALVVLGIIFLVERIG
jgi:manganese efflux pump family protein